MKAQFPGKNIKGNIKSFQEPNNKANDILK